MITQYPKLVNGRLTNLHGVATYSKNLAPELSNRLDELDRKLIIFADILEGDKEEIYEVGNTLVYRCWKKGDPFIFNKILHAFARFSSVSNILMHFEFNLFGDFLTTLSYPFFLLKCRFKKKNMTILMHQVVADLATLSGHINVKENSIKLKFLNFGLKKFYYITVLLANKVIVHEQILQERLHKIIKKMVFVIPHGLGNLTDICALVDARDFLKIPKKSFVVLCFGFVTWYKGSDWVVNKFAEHYKKTGDKNIKLIMAGGPSGTYKGKAHYKEFYKKLETKVADSPNITLTGFIPEEHIFYYYCASDLVVLPYRTQMSASGPFSIGLSFDRPFLLSDKLEGVLFTHDIKVRMSEFELKESDLLFKMRGDNFFNKISDIVADKELQEKLSKFSFKVKEDRLWSKLSLKFIDVIDA